MVDFHTKVPRGLRENLQYRVAIRRRAEKDEGFRRALMTACKHDVLFWLSAFVWLYEPRPRVINGKRLPHQLPFVPWEHQIPVIRRITENLGYCDIGVEKSRGEGMSWIAVMLALHEWLFEDMAKIGMVSSTEKKADNPEDPDSLGAKLDWELTKLPTWMAGVKDVDWKRNIDGHAWVNHRNGSRITAYAATADVARGGRAKWFLMDELGSFPRGPDKQAMASTQHVTDCRLVVSTPNGSEGAYYELMHEPSGENFVKVVLDWKDNPWRNRGLYRMEDNTPVAVDPVNNPLPDNYAEDVKDLHSRLRRKGFKLEGTIRSPWYDRECDRAGATPKAIAQELDRDYGGSMHRVFGHDFFEAATKHTRAPMSRGNMSYHPETLEPLFDTSDNGQFLLWTPLNVRKEPPKGQFVVGADVSAGLGGSFTSNSTILAFDLTNCDQVLEFASNTTEPRDLADLAIAVCKWLHDAYLIVEANGPGTAFVDQVKRRGYHNVYYRKILFKRGTNRTKEIGWWTSDKSKEALFSEFNRAVRAGQWILRSDALVQECGQYVRIKGKIEHVLSGRTEDDSSRGMAHGDRVIAAAVARIGANERPLMIPESKADPDNPPAHTMAARMKEYEQSLEKWDDEWDDRTSLDLSLGPK